MHRTFREQLLLLVYQENIGIYTFNNEQEWLTIKLRIERKKNR